MPQFSKEKKLDAIKRTSCSGPVYSDLLSAPLILKILNKENCSILISIEKCDILTEIKLFFPIKGKVSMKELEEWVLAEKAWQ